MLKRTKIKDLLASDTTIDEVLIKGWVKTKRDSKDFSFIEVNDGSCLKNIQVIANNTLNNYNDVKIVVGGIGRKHLTVLHKFCLQSGPFLHLPRFKTEIFDEICTCQRQAAVLYIVHVDKFRIFISGPAPA